MNRETINHLHITIRKLPSYLTYKGRETLPGVVVHSCNLSTWEAKVAKASLGYIVGLGLGAGHGGDRQGMAI